MNPVVILAGTVNTCNKLLKYNSSSILVFSLGSTERQILKNFETIVEKSLPVHKVAKYYQECSGSGKQVILNYVTFFEERIAVGATRWHLYMHVVV